jgi:hypothetical protein
MDEGHEPDTEESARLNEALRRELAELPESHRLPLLLHYCGGLDYQHIAAQIGCSAGNARVRVHRALERLRGRLGRAGFAAGAASILGQLHASEGASHLSPAMLAKCHTLLASTQAPILSTSAVLGGSSLAAKVGVAAASLVLLGGLSVPLVQHFSAKPPVAAPAVASQTAAVPPAVPAPPVATEAAVSTQAPPTPGIHHAHGTVIRIEPTEHRLLLRDGDRIEGYVMHRRTDGAIESAEAQDLAHRMSTLTVGSEVDIGWEPLRPIKAGEGGAESAHHDPAGEVPHRDPGQRTPPTDGERTPATGMAHRWHHRWLVSLDIITLAPPGQKPSGPTDKSDDL